MEISIFNNREIALFIWSLFLFVCLILQKNVRASLKGLVKVFFAKAIIVPLLLMILYIAVIVMFLGKLHLWNLSQLKNTIFWTISVAAVSFFKAGEIGKDPNFYIKTIKNNLKLIVILEFIVAYYPFNIFLELIIVPVTAAIGVCTVFTKQHPKIKAIANNILLLFGLVVLIHAIIKLVTNFSEFISIQTFTDFYLPPLLTIFFLPFLYLLVLFITYENGFLRINSLVKKPDVQRYAKIQSLLLFNVRISLFRRWLQHIVHFRIKAKSDVKKTINDIFKMVKVEKNPPKIPLNSGWSPYKAQKFLSKKNVQTGDYHPVAGGEWFSGSSYIEIGDDLFKNNIAYYIEGNSVAAVTLKLVMNINTLESAKSSHKIFLSYAKTLYLQALGKSVDKDLEKALLEGNEMQIEKDRKKINLTKNVWGETRMAGYSMRFVLQHI